MDDLSNKDYLIPIDFTSINQIPQSHIWSDQNNLDHYSNKQEMGLVPNIPIIDLEDPNVLDLIFHACNTWGVFLLTNHGVSEETLNKVEFQAMRLFSLPFEEKTKAVKTPENYTGYGIPRSSRYAKPTWCEVFTIVGNSVYNDAKKVWPNDYKEFCDVMVDYKTRMKDLSEKLRNLLLMSLNITEPVAYWTKCSVSRDTEDMANVLNLNSYPKCADPTKTMGLGSHTDTMFFTILYQSSNTNGLQVFKERLGWVPVNPVPGALIVNVGDLLQILSNGRFHSVPHKVLANIEKHRMSIPYFYAPPLDFEVSPFLDYPSCEGPRYTPVKVREYSEIKKKKNDLSLSSLEL